MKTEKLSGMELNTPEVDPALQNPYSCVVFGNARGRGSEDGKELGLWIAASLNLKPTDRL